MNTYLKKIVQDININRNVADPVKEGWISSCERIGLKKDDPFVEFGLLFTEHPDLSNPTNAYHNKSHAADAVISASHLATHEFTNNSHDLKHNGSYLLFSMLSHDIAHNGGHNSYDYELEQKAVLSMKDYVKSRPEMMRLWENKLASTYGSWDNFSNQISEIILGTDFKNGPTKNLQSYSINSQSTVKINQLKLLANEADILPSCTHDLGPKLGVQLAEEQNNPGVGSWSGRLFFLKNLAKFGSNASKNIHIQDHINQQVSLIEKFKPETLNEITQNKGLDMACSKISHDLQLQANSNFLNNFSNSLQSIRASIEPKTTNTNPMHYKS